RRWAHLVAFLPADATAIRTLSLHDALPIYRLIRRRLVLIHGRQHVQRLRGIVEALQHPIQQIRLEGMVRVQQQDPIADHIPGDRSEEHTSELQSRENLVCRLPLEKKKKGLW